MNNKVNLIVLLGHFNLCIGQNYNSIDFFAVL